MPSHIYGGTHSTPGIEAARETFELSVTGRHWEYNRAYLTEGLTIDGSARDTGNTGRTNVLRAGLPLGRRYGVATGQPGAFRLSTWDPTATNGLQDVYGILLETISVDDFGSDDHKFTGWVLTGGFVRSREIIVPGSTAAGLTGVANGNLLRQTMSFGGRFKFDDGIHDWAGPHQSHIHTATPYTATYQDANKLILVQSGTPAGALTLPSPANANGLVYHVVNSSGATLTVSPNAAAEIIGLGGNASLLNNESATIIGTANGVAGTPVWHILKYAAP